MRALGNVLFLLGVTLFAYVFYWRRLDVVAFVEAVKSATSRSPYLTLGVIAGVMAVLILIRPLAFARAVDAINEYLGKRVALLVLITVIISAVNAILRKLLNIGGNAYLEMQWILFAAVYLVCTSWTKLSNEHIRIDIINNMFGQRMRNFIDIFGHAFFLIPIAAVMVYSSWPFFYSSYQGNEQSSNAGGLPQYIGKFILVFGFFMLFWQGISELIKRIAITAGKLDDIHAAGGHHAAAEAEAQRVIEAAKAEAAKRGEIMAETR